MRLNEWTVNMQSDYASPRAALTAPTLMVSGQGCTATLSISDLSDGEKGFNVYRLSPWAISFTKLTSLPAPAVVEVQVTRRPGTDAPDIPQPTSCIVQIGVSAKNDSHVGQQLLASAGFEWTGVPIEGKVLTGGGPIPVLQPNASTSFPILLKPYSYWPPGHKVYAHQGWKYA